MSNTQFERSPWVLALLASVAVLASCDRGAGAPGGGPGGPPGGKGGPRGPIEFPVQVAPVEVRRVDYLVNAVGSVEAFEQVQVTARVSGVVEKIFFSEGDNLQEGAKLVEIEPKRFLIAVESAKAALARTEAQKNEAAAALQRREDANKKSPGLVREDDLEAARSKVQVAEAQAAEAKAAFELAQLNLRDALVRAPFGGTLESRNVRTGQYVQPGTLLATLIRREPMLLRFDVREDEAVKLKVGMPAIFTVRESKHEYSAKITHVAEAANTSSRMVGITAEVDDPERAALRPGTFAEVRVGVGAVDGVPVVPETAIRPSERGFLAFVVEDGVARMRTLSLGLRTTDGQIEVKSGVKAGERLVVRGGEALREGAKVKIEEAAPDATVTAEGKELGP